MTLRARTPCRARRVGLPWSRGRGSGARRASSAGIGADRAIALGAGKAGLAVGMAVAVDASSLVACVFTSAFMPSRLIARRRASGRRVGVTARAVRHRATTRWLAFGPGMLRASAVRPKLDELARLNARFRYTLRWDEDRRERRSEIEPRSSTSRAYRGAPRTGCVKALRSHHIDAVVGSTARRPGRTAAQPGFAPTSARTMRDFAHAAAQRCPLGASVADLERAEPVALPEAAVARRSYVRRILQRRPTRPCARRARVTGSAAA